MLSLETMQKIQTPDPCSFFWPHGLQRCWRGAAGACGTLTLLLLQRWVPSEVRLRRRKAHYRKGKMVMVCLCWFWFAFLP